MSEGTTIIVDEEMAKAPKTLVERLEEADNFLEATRVALEKLESVKDNAEFAAMHASLLNERARVEATRKEIIAELNASDVEDTAETAVAA